MLEYLNLWFWSTWKFLFAPSVGWLTGLNFIEIWVCHTLGGYSGFMFFYYFSSYFMKRAARRKRLKREAALAAGRPITQKNFTLLNKAIVRAKTWKYGYWIIMYLGASFISIPVGGVISAKFFPEKKRIVVDAFFVIASGSAILTFVWMFLENRGY